MPSQARNALDRMLTPLTDCRNAELVQRVLDFQIDSDTRSRIDLLARQANAGQLTDAERDEYLDYVEAIDLIGILQSKARSA